MKDLLSRITDIDRLKQLLEEDVGGKQRIIRVEEMRDALRARVKGQDHVIDDLVRYVREQWGKVERKRPIASFLFLGPTGTGKTELAKAIAEYLFDDEKAIVDFNGSEFSGPEGKTRLIGTPTGYVGAQAGGALTRPMLANPKRVVLFDEIDKAYSGIQDLFLQMLGDGKLTEQGSGQVADFTQSIIVLTSNAEAEAIGKIQRDTPDYHEMVNAVKSHLADTGRFRAEICGRFDRVYVFKPLEGIVIAEIAALKMSVLAKQYGLELEFIDPELIFQAMKNGNKLKKFGVRALDNVINDMLAARMLDAQQARQKRIRIDSTPDGELTILPAEQSLDPS